jgi:hypothetical protein
MEWSDWFGMTGIYFIVGLTAYAWLGMVISDAIGSATRPKDVDFPPHSRADIAFTVVYVVFGIVLFVWWLIRHL